MKGMGRAYVYISTLSIDVVAGAVAGGAFFARLFDVILPLPVYVVLALTVWIVYTLDHLRDARRIQGRAATVRHAFHQTHFKGISIAVALVAGLNVCLIWFLRDRVLLPGTALGAVVVLYLVFQHRLRFLKEVIVAALYTAGILLPVYAFGHPDPSALQGIAIVKYFITALMNLLLFSLFDFEKDTRQGQESFVTWFGPRQTTITIIILGALNIVTGYWLWSSLPVVAIMFVAMNLSLLAVLMLRRRFAVNDLYRMLGDAVFYLPGVVLWL